MKRFLITCWGLVLVFSTILLLNYNYQWKVVLYHILIMSTIIGSFAVFLFALSNLVKKQPLINLLTDLFSALFFFLFLLFYVFVLASNHFWHKTITLSILKNYTSSFSDFLSIVPVQREIVIGCIFLYLVLNVIAFLIVRPSPQKIREHSLVFQQPGFRKKWLMGIALIGVLLIIFFKSLLQFKRIMHMAEEPFLQFTLGVMWGNNNDIAFDRLRYQNGLKDKACIDSVAINANEHTTVIILIDGLRADHLPIYGYTRNTAPFLDSMYRSGKLLAVQNAFSTSTNTIGGIAGLFFSKDWEEFGFNGLSLMKFFKKAGYKTYAFLTGFHRDWYGLSALYRESSDVYYESSDNPDVKTDDDLITLKKLKASSIDKKSFLFIHLLSVHLIGKKNNEFKKFFPDKMGFNTDKKTALINNYDNGIVQSDFVIRSIFEKLRNENLLSNSTVFVLSDHGELFGEDNSWGHGDNVHENLLSVPLLIYDEQLNWYKNLDAATLKDIPPTIVNRIGSPIPTCWEGRSLHQPSQNFSVEVNSAEVCTLPHGVLSKTDSVIKLQIMNEQRQVQRTVLKKGNEWVKTD